MEGHSVEVVARSCVVIFREPRGDGIVSGDRPILVQSNWWEELKDRIRVYTSQSVFVEGSGPRTTHNF